MSRDIVTMIIKLFKHFVTVAIHMRDELLSSVIIYVVLVCVCVCVCVCVHVRVCVYVCVCVSVCVYL